MKIIYIETHLDKPTYPILSTQDKVIERVELSIITLKKLYKDKHLSFLCMGSSGLFIATILKLKIPNSSIIYIRKENESAHDYDRIIEDRKSRNTKTIVIFVDDFIENGTTFNQCYKYSIAPINAILTISGSHGTYHYDVIKKQCKEWKNKIPKYFIKVFDPSI